MFEREQVGFVDKYVILAENNSIIVTQAHLELQFYILLFT